MPAGESIRRLAVGSWGAARRDTHAGIHPGRRCRNRSATGSRCSAAPRRARSDLQNGHRGASGRGERPGALARFHRAQAVGRERPVDPRPAERDPAGGPFGLEAHGHGNAFPGGRVAAFAVLSVVSVARRGGSGEQLVDRRAEQRRPEAPVERIAAAADPGDCARDAGVAVRNRRKTARAIAGGAVSVGERSRGAGPLVDGGAASGR